MKNSGYQLGRRVILVGIIVNIVIAAVKISFGLLGKSAVLVAEAFDSLSDVAATTAVLIGFKLSSSPKDESHPHGHGKIDSLIALFVGMAIAATGLFLLYQNAVRIYLKEYMNPEWIALFGILTAILMKTGLYIYTTKANKELNSPSIRANAYDHKADVYRLSGVFFGVLFAIVGHPILDPIAALIVSLMIIKMAYVVMRDAIADLVDVQMPDKIINKIEKVVNTWNPEYRLVNAIGRRMGGQYQVNARVLIDPYIRALDGTSDLRKLEKCIIDTVPEIQGIDITTQVNKEDAKAFEKQFRDYVFAALDKFKDQYLSIENAEFHFMTNQQEFHCDMFLSPLLPVQETDRIRQLIKQEIVTEFEHAQVIITIRPASVH